MPDLAMTKRSQATWYTTAWLGLLGLIALLYYTVAHGVFSAHAGLHDALVGAWFAMLGGVAISYKGIVDHRTPTEWNGWMTWYLVRPFTSFIVGLLTYELLRVANAQATPSLAALAVIAFVFGTQERRFFAFLYEVAKLVLTTPADTQPALQVKSFKPESGPAGTLLLIQGQGFVTGATATIGGAPLTQLVPSTDGTMLAGIVPAGQGSQDVIVVNPDNSSQRAPKQFTYH